MVGRELSSIMLALKRLEDFNDQVNEYDINSIRRSVDIIAQRGLRAEQIARGPKVDKPR